jgi:hypothetical protein
VSDVSLHGRNYIITRTLPGAALMFDGCATDAVVW